MAADRIAFFIFSQPLFLIRHQKKAVYLVVYEQLPASPPGALIYHNRNCRHGQVLPSRIVSKKRNFSKNVLFMGSCLINTLKGIKNCSGCQADRLNLRVWVTHSGIGTPHALSFAGSGATSAQNPGRFIGATRCDNEVLTAAGFQDHFPSIDQ
ncbi:hypothetical protein [Agrobacterium rosae]|uniref:hypothetical protein n=1 Tax=Agrobacterium rosae TaxID=1972867 RepID=UPI003A80F42A